MRRLKKIGLLAMALACAGLIAPVAGAATIDTFAGDFQQVSDSTSDNVAVTSVYDSSLAPDAIGGYRELYVNRDAGVPGFTSLTVDGGVAFSNNNPVVGMLNYGVAHITWDGTANIAGPAPITEYALGEDFTAWSQFHIVTPGNLLNDSMVSVELWDSSGSYSGPVSWTLANNTANHYLSFSNFAGFDFANVGAIRLNFLTDNVYITSFGVVPVPPAVGLGLLGMMVVGGLRRRKKASAA
ncbi:MAG: hypothetical protein KF886_08140 [Candidatus Hydrogenedentes bacterium]|nr:hypothetical protein [Candidatus Hydrogenedentota bacterium]